MSEENRVQANPEVEMYKLYVQKLEKLLQETERKMLSHEVNADIQAVQITQLTTSLEQANQYVSNAKGALDALVKERDELKSKVGAQNISTEQVPNLIRERDAAQRSRDDFYRELQNEITKSNKLVGDITKLTNDYQELAESNQALLAELEELKAPKKKAAKVK